MQQRHLKTEYHTFDGERRRLQAWTAHRELDPPSTKDLGQFIFHKLLLDILKGCILTTHVLKFKADKQCSGFDDYFY